MLTYVTLVQQGSWRAIRFQLTGTGGIEFITRSLGRLWKFTPRSYPNCWTSDTGHTKRIGDDALVTFCDITKIVVRTFGQDKPMDSSNDKRLHA